MYWLYCGILRLIRNNESIMLKATPHNLKKIETIFKESGYKIRYGKGNFHAGYCILDDQQQIVVNKFYSLEIKMSILSDLLNDENINIDREKATEKSLNLMDELVKERSKLAIKKEKEAKDLEEAKVANAKKLEEKVGKKLAQEDSKETKAVEDLVKDLAAEKTENEEEEKV